MNIAVVTGASSGMGREFVVQISKKYKTLDEIWVIARRQDKLCELKREISSVNIRVIPMDITDSCQMDDFKKLLQAKKPCIRVLVNGAGYGIIGEFTEIAQDNVGMCKLNCLALTDMINICIPYLNKKKSNIINLASAAAFAPQPSFAV